MVEWSRGLDVRLSEWCCSVSMVWVQIPSREGQNLTALISNSKTVWFNFQTYIYIYIWSHSSASLLLKSKPLSTACQWLVRRLQWQVLYHIVDKSRHSQTVIIQWLTCMSKLESSIQKSYGSQHEFIDS